MLDYGFNEFVIIYSLYFVFHYLFIGRLKKKKDLYWIYQSKDRIGKINNSVKILKNIPRNLIRFPIKPNIGIVTFLSIQIARHHIPSNLNVRNNVDFLVPNAT